MHECKYAESINKFSGAFPVPIAFQNLLLQYFNHLDFTISLVFKSWSIYYALILIAMKNQYNLNILNTYVSC